MSSEFKLPESPDEQAPDGMIRIDAKVSPYGFFFATPELRQRLVAMARDHIDQQIAELAENMRRAQYSPETQPGRAIAEAFKKYPL